jgi:hypothetical protein
MSPQVALSEERLMGQVARRRALRAGSLRRRPRGVLLIEVLMSMLLLFISAAGSLAMLMVVIRSVGFSNAAQTASRLGQEVLDRVMLEPFAAVGQPGSACVASEANLFGTGASGTSGAGNSIPYTRTCSVGLLGNGMAVVRVAVSWVDGNDRQRTLNLAVQRAP